MDLLKDTRSSAEVPRLFILSWYLDLSSDFLLLIWKTTSSKQNDQNDDCCLGSRRQIQTLLPVAANQLPQETLQAITGGDRSKVILNIGRRLSLELSHRSSSTAIRELFEGSMVSFMQFFLQNATWISSSFAS